MFLSSLAPGWYLDTLWWMKSLCPSTLTLRWTIIMFYGRDNMMPSFPLELRIPGGVPPETCIFRKHTKRFWCWKSRNTVWKKKNLSYYALDILNMKSYFPWIFRQLTDQNNRDVPEFSVVRHQPCKCGSKRSSSGTSPQYQCYSRHCS